MPRAAAVAAASHQGQFVPSVCIARMAKTTATAAIGKAKRPAQRGRELKSLASFSCTAGEASTKVALQPVATSW